MSETAPWLGPVADVHGPKGSVSSALQHLASVGMRQGGNGEAMIMDLLRVAAEAIDLDLTYVARLNVLALEVVYLHDRAGISPSEENMLAVAARQLQALQAVPTETTPLGGTTVQ